MMAVNRTVLLEEPPHASEVQPKPEYVFNLGTRVYTWQNKNALKYMDADMASKPELMYSYLLRQSSYFSFFV
jgi:hypothetical protein